MWTPILFLLSKCSCLQKNKKYTRTAQLASNNRRGKKELAKFQHYSYLVPLLYTMAEGKLHRCNSRITTHFLIVARNISSSAPNSNCIASMRAIKAQHSRKRQYETTTKKAFCLIFQSDHGKRKSEMKKKRNGNHVLQTSFQGITDLSKTTWQPETSLFLQPAKLYYGNKW